MSNTSTATNGEYAINTSNDGHKAVVEIKPLRSNLPAADATIDRVRGDDGSVTITIETKKPHG